MKKISRRDALKTGAAAAGMAVLGMLPADLSANDNPAAGRRAGHLGRKKILVVGAHPDDAETGCGGTMILLAQAGHHVVSVCLTRGEAGIPGKTHQAAAAIRTAESEAACKLTGATPLFLTQVDGSTEINAERYDEMLELMRAERPDVVLTHWPIDGHRDHRICSLLVHDAWLRLKRSFRLYYFEVESGQQTQHFFPTDFVDIEPVLERKHQACHCHASQGMDEVYASFHATMEKFRGIQAHCRYAEAFVRHNQTENTLL